MLRARRLWAILLLFFLPAAGAEGLFGLDRLTDVAIRMDAGEWERVVSEEERVKSNPLLVAIGMGRVMRHFRERGNFRSHPEARPGLAGYLGIEHPYGRGTVAIGEDVLEGAGIRYKGNGTFLEGLKRGVYSFKIDFREYESGLEHQGMTKLNLHSNVLDPTLLREPLSLEVFRLAGVPCSRLGFARVELEVAGEAKWTRLYTVVEQIDKRFLRNRFGSSKGLLLKPSTVGVFRYLGEEWEPYGIAYVPKTEPTGPQKRRVMDFARLVNRGSDEEFSEQVEDYIAMEPFLRFLCGHVLLSHLDSFLSAVQNYYVYLDEGSGQFHFLPWDFDLSLGAFMLEGSRSDRLDLSVRRPAGDRNRLLDRILAITEYRSRYEDMLAGYLESLFNEERLGPLAKRALATIASADPDFDADGSYRTTISWIGQRARSIRTQLEGRHEGYVPFRDNWIGPESRD